MSIRGFQEVPARVSATKPGQYEPSTAKITPRPVDRADGRRISTLRKANQRTHIGGVTTSAGSGLSFFPTQKKRPQICEFVQRWTFDASHDAIANGSFATPANHLTFLEFAPSAAIPEPSSLALFVVGALALTCVFGKRRRPS